MSKASKSDLDASSFNGAESLSIEAGDQAPKFEKLVQDYLKLRSKLTVLKKAYVEQCELSTQKDQSIRKFELEIEALSFRNQQMSVRVECLQRELEEKSHKGAVNPSSSSSDSSINSMKPSAELLAEELQHKIEENQSLHRRLNELEVDLRQKLVKNEEMLRQVEYEKILLEKKLQALELSSKTSVEKLENDKIKLELNVIQLEDQLRSIHVEKEQLILKKENETSLVSNKLEKLVSINENRSNVHFQSVLITSFESLRQIYSSIEDLVGKKSTIFKCVSKCALLLKQIANAFAECKVNQIDSILTEYSNSNHEMLLMIVENLLKTNQNPEMDKLNKKLKIYVNKLDQFLYMDDSNFSQLVVKVFQSFNSGKPMINSESLVSQIQILIDILEKLLFALNEKLSLKYTLDYSLELTTLDECLVSYITQFKQHVYSLQSTPGLIESIVQLKNDLYPDKQEESEQMNTAEILELKSTIELKENYINELEIKCEELKSKCENYDSDIADLRSKLALFQTETSQREITETVDDMEKSLDRPTFQLYECQIEILNKQIQHLDSKAVYYYDEMMSLIERLKLQMSINDSLSHDLNEIKDQLERTRSSYEMQISTMSDHLIEVTERMSKQSEENDKLKHELEMVYSSKSTKAKRTK